MELWKSPKWISTVLLLLVLLDGVLTIWGFFFPHLWASFFHQLPYQDPLGLLPRAAASWLAFLLLQLTALLFWHSHPWLLLLVAGARFADCLTDIVCLLSTDQASLYAYLLFPLAGVGNVLLGVFFVLSYHCHSPKD